MTTSKLKDFIATLHENKTVTGFNLYGEKQISINSKLVISVLNQIRSDGFLAAAQEAAIEEELGNGYDLFKDGSYVFFENNKALLLELIATLALADDCTVSEFVFGCSCSVVFPLVEREHTDAIIDSKTQINAIQVMTDAMGDAYEIVSYQLGAHAIMAACSAYNHYNTVQVAKTA